MKHTILATIAAGALVCTAAIATADAMPSDTLAATPLPLASAEPGVTLVSGGCGIYGHRGYFGHCRANIGRYRYYGWRRRYYY